MFYFENDYCEGAHPAILQKLMETNFEKVSGYGTDPYCASAREKIRAACACPEADVTFISGGTQTNAIVIASMLHRWEGVVAASTGHVNGHEAGAIEYTGHKVLGLPHKNGKLDAADVRDFCATFYADGNHDHMVFPGMVYISHPTEYGTLYTKAELQALHDVCQMYHMPLFVDGARLGYGLAAEGTDVTLPDLARLADVFYIGGTKVGALCGEAVVFPHGAPAHFMTMVKQQGALLAKGRLLGLPFDVLFTDDLYQTISRNAIATANALKQGWPPRATASSWIRPPTRSSSFSPTSSWRRWRARPNSASGRSSMTPIPSCASPPAGPPGWRRSTACWPCCKCQTSVRLFVQDADCNFRHSMISLFR